MAQKTKPKGDAPDNSSIAKYLDDGRIGNVSNLIRFRAGIAYTGYLGLSYERKITRKFGLELGTYYKPSKGALFEDYRFTEGVGYDYYGDKTIAAVKGGVAFMAYPKLYITGKKINSGYFFGLRTTYKSYKVDIHERGYINYDQNGVKASHVGAFITAGSHQHVGKRFVFGVEWGLGYVKEVYMDVSKTDYDDVNSKYIIVPTKGKTTVNSFPATIDMVFGFLF